MYMYTLHCLYSVLHCLYAAWMVTLHMPIYMFMSITSPLTCSFLSCHHQTILFIISTGYDYRLDPMITGLDDMFISFYCLHVYIFLLLLICLLYGITISPSCIIYYYRACITIVYITASFILPLTRSLSDDPGFACPGWRSELPQYPRVPWSCFPLICKGKNLQ